MSYVFTSSNGFLKIVNAATGYEASTPNPLDISVNTNQVTGAPGIKLINADISLLMDLIEIATIGGVAAAGTVDGVINQIAAMASPPGAGSNTDTAALITHTAASVGVPCTDQTNYNCRGLQVGVNITAGTGTSPTLQVFIEGKDAASGQYYTLFASAAIAATPGFTALSLYPGLTGSTTIGNQVLSRIWRVRTVIGGATPAVTATIGASVIV